jgi:hypothetical protein
MRRFITVLAALVGAFAFAGTASAATQYVSPFPVVIGPGTSCTLPNFNSIQLAVSAAAPGDTIVVCDGVYPEQVVINRDLSLIGSGNSEIKAPASMSGDLVTVMGPVDVSMSHFIVAGPVPGGCGTIQAGIRVRDQASLNLSYTSIRDIRGEPLSGCQNGEAIRVGMRGDGAGPGHATIDHVIADDYQKNGITVNGEDSTANIMNTTVSGVGPTAVLAQNGIQVSRGAAATINTSTIRDHEYSPKGVVACGLIIFEANGVNDDQNVFLNNEKDKCTFSGRGGTYEGMP